MLAGESSALVLMGSSGVQVFTQKKKEEGNNRFQPKSSLGKTRVLGLANLAYFC